MKDRETCQINVFDRVYHIDCPDEEKTSLYEAAAYLDRKMRNMSHKSITTSMMGLDQLAVVTALNIIYDAFNKKNPHAISAVDDRVDALCHEIELALNAHE